MTHPTVIVFVKEPRPGRVKTRLARDIGRTTAAQWYRTQTARLLREIAYDPRWTAVLAVSPDHAGLHSRFWPANIKRVAQGSGDLGQRMARSLNAAPPGRALIIGSDIPHLGARHIAAALNRLHHNDVVFGPASDGGYWAVGVRKGAGTLPRDTFANVRWSTEHALEDSIASFGSARIGLADRLDDVDTYADLKRLSDRR
jgi:rSAM/selenodomain-associated transferase 1